MVRHPSVLMRKSIEVQSKCRLRKLCVKRFIHKITTKSIFSVLRPNSCKPHTSGNNLKNSEIGGISKKKPLRDTHST